MKSPAFEILLLCCICVFSLFMKPTFQVRMHTLHKLPSLILFDIYFYIFSVFLEGCNVFVKLLGVLLSKKRDL